MLAVIEQLLVLQDRDRRLLRVRAELAAIEPQRQAMKAKSAGAAAAHEKARQRTMQIESRRKELDLEIEGQKKLIERYTGQQLQTRKNDEYQALTKEIEHCQAAITRIEDQQLELMEQAEGAQQELAAAAAALKEAQALVERELAQLAASEVNLKRELADLEAERARLAAAVDESVRNRYERILKSRGDKVLVGIEHGVCGGCHMRIPAQIVVQCRAQQELVNCTNCGRLLYYSRDMDLAVAD
ncbi:MAG: zinc ribbon domain-containing protein [Limisphaerales bacterium]